MKTPYISIFLLALFTSMPLVAQSTSDLENGGHLNFLDASIQTDWLRSAYVNFYVLGMPNGDSKKISECLHPALERQREALTERLIKSVKGKKLGSYQEQWHSGPIFLGHKKGLSQASKTPDARHDGDAKEENPSTTNKVKNASMLVLGSFSLKNGEPSVQKKQGVNDKGKAVTLIHNDTSPRLDLWIREEGVWYVIPNESLLLEAALQGVTDISMLIKQTE